MGAFSTICNCPASLRWQMIGDPDSEREPPLLPPQFSSLRQGAVPGAAATPHGRSTYQYTPRPSHRSRLQVLSLRTEAEVDAGSLDRVGALPCLDTLDLMGKRCKRRARSAYHPPHHPTTPHHFCAPLLCRHPGGVLASAPHAPARPVPSAQAARPAPVCAAAAHRGRLHPSGGAVCPYHGAVGRPARRVGAHGSHAAIAELPPGQRSAVCVKKWQA